MDIGGHRFFSKNEDVIKMWKEIMPIQNFPSYDDKFLGIEKSLERGNANPELMNDIWLIRNRVSRILYNKSFFDYPISLKLETFKNMGLVNTFKVGTSYLKSCFKKLNEDSLEAFYINRFGKQLYSMFFEGYTEKVWGRNPSIISPDWGTQRVKGLSIKVMLSNATKKILKINNKNVETSLIEEFMYPKYGPGHFWECVAHKIEQMGGKINFKHKVTDIHLKTNEIDYINCNTPNGIKKIEGDIFISSMPLKDLINSINNLKKVPKNIYKIANGLPYRDFVTIGLLLNKLNLKNTTNNKTISNIIPDDWIYVQDKNVKLGRIQIFNNWSPYMVKDIHNTIWIGLEYFCQENDEFWNMSDNDAKNFAINELVKLNIIDKKNVIDYHREKIKKAYPAYFDTYYDMDELKIYLNKINNLYCIGRNGQHKYNNMDHSMMTAFKTVNCLINGENKNSIWNVNIEKEYHEDNKRKSIIKQ